MRNPTHAASLNCTVDGNRVRKGIVDILIERDAEPSDFVDGFPASVVSFNPHTNRVGQWISLAEAEHLEIIAPDDAARLREAAGKKVAA